MLRNVQGLGVRGLSSSTRGRREGTCLNDRNLHLPPRVRLKELDHECVHPHNGNPCDLSSSSSSSSFSSSFCERGEHLGNNELMSCVYVLCVCLVCMSCVYVLCVCVVRMSCVYLK